MFLSKLILNPRNRRVQREIADPYQMHRSLMRAFPDNLSPAAERVLRVRIPAAGCSPFQMPFPAVIPFISLLFLAAQVYTRVAKSFY